MRAWLIEAGHRCEVLLNCHQPPLVDHEFVPRAVTLHVEVYLR